MNENIESVFIVVKGEEYEGYTISSVHKTLDKAIVAAVSLARKDDGYNRLSEIYYWSNGCDYVTIKEREIEE